MSAAPPHEPASSRSEWDTRPPLVADASALVEVAEGVWVLPDRERTPHVANVGIVVGANATLTIDTGTGVRNGARILEITRTLGEGRRHLLTITHIHPEHGSGAQCFTGAATLLYNRAQRDELREKGLRYLELFSSFGAHLAEALAGVELVMPEIVYDGTLEIDLGGVRAVLSEYGPAHTRGDQVVWIPERRVVFPGDLVESRFFPVMDDLDVRPERWLGGLERIARLAPEVVVGGHGAIGGPSLLDAVRGSMLGVRARVAELAQAGATRQRIVATVAPETLERNPDWENREWVVPEIEQWLRELDPSVVPGGPREWARA